MAIDDATPHVYVQRLFRPLYVLQMNWRTMSKEKRLDWLEQMSQACEDSRFDIDNTLDQEGRLG